MVGSRARCEQSNVELRRVCDCVRLMGRAVGVQQSVAAGEVESAARSGEALGVFRRKDVRAVAPALLCVCPWAKMQMQAGRQMQADGWWGQCSAFNLGKWNGVGRKE